METVRKTFKEKLRTTPEQEQALDVVLWRCRTLYNVALEQRKTAWERCHVSVKRFAQEAELANIRAEFPEYTAIYSHVLQDVLARLDKAYQAFFRRVAAGETPGYPQFQGRNRYHSFTYKEYGNGARVENGHLVLSKIGQIAVHWSRRTHAGTLKGTIKTVTISSRQTARQSRILGTIAGPRKPSRRRSAGYPDARRAVNAAAKRYRCWLRGIRRCDGKGRTSTTRQHSTSRVGTTRSIWKTCRWPI